MEDKISIIKWIGIADYNQAIKIKPDYAGAYYNRTLAYQIKGKRDFAIADLKRILQITNNANILRIVQKKLQELGVK